ncbi:MAG: hypothetical protein JWQ95_4164 [Sphaerisporangium sp.]|nr:hypothetical protein [Sphaerisporangium sp.]
MNSRPGAVPASTFARSLVPRGNLPLRVAVYSEIAQAIRSGVLGLGQLLPSEPELSAAFGVSRSVLREALILLEEDGLIRNQRGIGRFVVDVLPAIGLEQLQPMERMLAAPGLAARTVQRRKATLEITTDFTQRGLQLAADEVVLMWESVILADDLPVALTQEWVSSGETLAAIDPGLEKILEERHGDSVTMFTALGERLGAVLGPGVCDVSVSTAGSERAHMLGVASADPVLVLCQRVLLNAWPLYVAKHIVAPEAGHLSVVQNSSS